MKAAGFLRAPNMASVTINSADFFVPFQVSFQNIFDFFTVSSNQLTASLNTFLQQLLGSFYLSTDNMVQGFGQSMNSAANSLASGQLDQTGYGNGGYYY